MTDDAKMIIQCLFSSVWRIFTSWHIPGTNVSPAEFFITLLFCAMVFRFLSDVFGTSLSGNVRDTSARGGEHGSLRIPFRHNDDVE